MVPFKSVVYVGHLRKGIFAERMDENGFSPVRAYKTRTNKLFEKVRKVLASELTCLHDDHSYPLAHG